MILFVNPRWPRFGTKLVKFFQLSVWTDSFLGAGTFGYVFRAQRRPKDLDGNREMALKIVVKDGTINNKAVQRSQETVPKSCYGRREGRVHGIRRWCVFCFCRMSAYTIPFLRRKIFLTL